MSVVSAVRNYTLFCTVDNFDSGNKELDFGDFKIKAIRQGPEAAEWRKRLHCKGVPKYVLEKGFSNYIVKAGDVSGFDSMMQSMQDLLAIFRLFRMGDIGFGNYLFEDKEDENNNAFNMANSPIPSYPLYKFDNDEIMKFNDFKNKTLCAPGYRNPFFQFALSYFMRGIEKGSFKYARTGSEKLIDYFVALESIFLIDGERYFLGRTLAKRVSSFLSDSHVEGNIKSMYNVRSRILHGDFIEEPSHWPVTPNDGSKFEETTRRIFIKLFEHDFSAKDDMVWFMKGLFNIPEKALKIMHNACDKAKKLIV